MNAMLRPGERDGCCSRRWLRRVGACAALLACALTAAAWTTSATASVLYRCTGPGGEVAYVSKTVGYHGCKEIGHWGGRPEYAAERRAAPPASKPAKSHAKVLPGAPPRPVSANPSVLTITPLGGGHAVPVAPVRTDALQPLPIVAMRTLASWLLPRVLGVEAAPVRATPAPAASTLAPAKSSAAGAPVSAQRAAANPQPAAYHGRLGGGAVKYANVPATPGKLPTKALPPRRGAVYRVVQKNGTVMYTNIKSLAHGHGAKMLFTYVIECYACNVHSKINWDTVPLHLAAYRGDIVAAAKLTGVDAALLRAVIHAESGFNARALSYKGAQGLMQLMPGTAFELGVGDAFDPAENISGGARYLSMLLRDYHGDVKLAAAAYNAGANAVAKYGGVPPYAETRVYVKRVALLYARYRKALASRANGAADTLATAQAD